MRAGAAVLIVSLLAMASTAFGAGEALPDPQRIVLGGSGGWDYLSLDGRRHHLFISRSDRVQVFDTVTEKVVAEIADTQGVHGIALAQDLSLGFTSNGKSNSVTVFDLGALKTIDEIEGVGDGPDAIVYEPKTARVFTFNGRSRSATAIDVASRRVVATISLPGKPEFAVTDGAATLFVNIEDKNLVERIDAATGKVTAEWAMGACERPSGLDIDVVRRRLFSVCANRKMVVLDADSGHLVAEAPIGSGVDEVVFDPLTSLVLSSNGEGTVTFVRERSPGDYVAVATARTHRGARTIAVDTAAHRAYLVTSDFDPVSAAASAAPRPRPAQTPGTFSVFVLDFASIRPRAGR